MKKLGEREDGKQGEWWTASFVYANMPHNVRLRYRIYLWRVFQLDTYLSWLGPILKSSGELPSGPDPM